MIQSFHPIPFDSIRYDTTPFLVIHTKFSEVLYRNKTFANVFTHNILFQVDWSVFFLKIKLPKKNTINLRISGAVMEWILLHQFSSSFAYHKTIFFCCRGNVEQSIKCLQSGIFWKAQNRNISMYSSEMSEKNGNGYKYHSESFSANSKLSYTKNFKYPICVHAHCTMLGRLSHRKYKCLLFFLLCSLHSHYLIIFVAIDGRYV